VNGIQSRISGDWAKTLREAKLLSQTELADKMGFARSMVSRVESGDREPTADFVVAFAVALGLDIDETLVVSGLIPADFLAARKDGVLGDAKEAFEIARLLNAIPDDDERENAIADIRALLHARASRLAARQAHRPDRTAAARGKPAR
jgi:transcriptional regulator with XRE-family HTH domain